MAALPKLAQAESLSSLRGACRIFPPSVQCPVELHGRGEASKPDRVDGGLGGEERSLGIQHRGEVGRAGAVADLGKTIGLARVGHRLLLQALLRGELLDAGERVFNLAKSRDDA